MALNPGPNSMGYHEDDDKTIVAWLKEPMK